MGLYSQLLGGERVSGATGPAGGLAQQVNTRMESEAVLVEIMANISEMAGSRLVIMLKKGRYTKGRYTKAKDTPVRYHSTTHSHCISNYSLPRSLLLNIL